ncbi:MAG: tetratricopeptide repeat protein [Saprospiraceae bacterium]
MENQLSPPSFEQLAKYVLGGLTSDEQDAIEKLVLADSYYMDLVNNLMDFCDRQEIYDLSELNIALSKKQHLVFERLENFKLKETPSETPTQADTPASKPTTSKSPNTKKWLLAILGFIILGLLILFFIRDNTQVSKTDNEINTSINKDVDNNTDADIEETEDSSTTQDTLTPKKEIKELEEVDMASKQQIKKKKDTPLITTEQPQPQPLLAVNLNNDYYKFEIDLPERVKSTNIAEQYILGDYSEVVQELEQNSSLKTFDYESIPSNYLLAKSYLQLNEPEKAIFIFEKLYDLESGVTRLKPRIKWYLARAYLMTGNKKRGLDLLKESTTLPYHKQATELLNKLKEDQFIE